MALAMLREVSDASFRFTLKVIGYPKARIDEIRIDGKKVEAGGVIEIRARKPFTLDAFVTNVGYRGTVWCLAMIHETGERLSPGTRTAELERGSTAAFRFTGTAPSEPGDYTIFVFAGHYE